MSAERHSAIPAATFDAGELHRETLSGLNTMVRPLRVTVGARQKNLNRTVLQGLGGATGEQV